MRRFPVKHSHFGLSQWEIMTTLSCFTAMATLAAQVLTEVAVASGTSILNPRLRGHHLRSPRRETGSSSCVNTI